MKWYKKHSLTLVMMGLFLAFWIAQSIAGHIHYNQEQTEHQSQSISYSEYLVSGEFIEATFENWESEFLQMAAYVFLTAFLVQKGSAESRKLVGREPQDSEPRRFKAKGHPWLQKLYENSLGLALTLLFLISSGLHAYGGARATCEENLQHRETECQSTMQYAGTSKFWFESFQNWQSEFLAVGSIVVLSIFLRQKGSPESKPVSAPHTETGT